MATTLFPADVAAAAAAHKPLVEFRAGRMNRSGTKVKADPRKGLFYMDVVWALRLTCPAQRCAPGSVHC